jgi:ADP-ribosylation factor related protein 1
MWEKYYDEADAVMFVVDSADIGRLEEAKLAYDSVCEHDNLSKVPVLTIANKQDLPGALSSNDLSINFLMQQLPSFNIVSYSKSFDK